MYQCFIQPINLKSGTESRCARDETISRDSSPGRSCSGFHVYHNIDFLSTMSILSKGKNKETSTGAVNVDGWSSRQFTWSKLSCDIIQHSRLDSLSLYLLIITNMTYPVCSNNTNCKCCTMQYKFSSKNENLNVRLCAYVSDIQWGFGLGALENFKLKIYLYTLWLILNLSIRNWDMWVRSSLVWRCAVNSKL